MSIMKNFLSMIIILCVCLNCCFTEGAEKKESGKVDSYTIQVSSLFPSSSSCVLSSKASNTKSSLRVVHMHGACSHLRSKKDARIDHDEILRRDQARVESIHSKLSKNNAYGVSMTKSTELRAKSGITLGSGNYIVTVGIGTPKHDISLAFDTGSDLTWTQCQPCLRSCYSQQEPIFNPSTSSSYQNVSCLSPMCGNNPSCNSDNNCGYRIHYGDGSVTNGVLAKEKFTLTNSDVVDNVYFGCGDNNTGLFFRTAGILGLGRGERSLTTQTATTYNNIFSYCLPSSASNTGHLTFGSAGISGSAKFTPFTSFPIPSLYGITIVGISVGDKSLEITPTSFSTNGAIIDSGTVITRLPTKVYAELRDVFKEKMSSYKAASGRGIFDTCYDFTGLDTMTIPKIAFSFAGGTVVELAEIGIMYPLSESQVCLAFAGNDELPLIFGNVQQKTMEIVYDVAGGRVGFAPNGCS